MIMLGNFTRRLLLSYKQLLYRTYIMPITLYGFQLWYYKEVLLFQPLKELKKIQQKAVLWITDIFYTLLSWELEVIAGLIPIHMHLDKISRRYYLQVASLPQQHALNSLMDKHYSKKTKFHHLSIAYLICKQWSKIKSSIVDTNNYLNKVFPLFNRLYKELSPGFHLANMFPNHFSFHTVNYKNTNTKTAYCNKLNKIFEEFLLNLNTIFIISNASVKKKVATSISHVQKDYNIIAKTIHHIMNITSTEVELISIKCKINQAVQLPNVDQIIVIINAILL